MNILYLKTYKVIQYAFLPVLKRNHQYIPVPHQLARINLSKILNTFGYANMPTIILTMKIQKE